MKIRVCYVDGKVLAYRAKSSGTTKAASYTKHEKPLKTFTEEGLLVRWLQTQGHKRVLA